MDRVSVEQGNYQDGSDIVNDSQSQQHGYQRLGYPGAEQGDYSDGKGDIGGHRYAPAIGFGPRAVEQQIKSGRYDHSPDCRADGENCLSQIGQFADEYFSLDFKPDDKKEQRHKTVVDPMLDGLADIIFFCADAELGMKNRIVDWKKWAVGYDQRQCHTYHQEYAGGSFLVEKFLYG